MTFYNPSARRTVFGWLAIILGFCTYAAAQQPATTPLVKPVAITRPVTPGGAVAPPTAADVLDIRPADIKDPALSHQGVLIESQSGDVLMDQFADQTFNPASAIKLATAFAALHNFGPHYRFTTVLWTTGSFDPATGTVTGDLVLSGRDPSLHYEQAVLMASELNNIGIKIVTGDLIVSPLFSMNFDTSAQRSGDRLYDTLDSNRRPVAAQRSWNEYQRAFNHTATTNPNVAVMGAVYVDNVPKQARVIVQHRSSELTDILKVMLCYSNNFMAERLGEAVGGAVSLQQFLVKELKLKPEEVQLASTSGLGVNRVTPRAMMKIYRGLYQELAKHQMTPADIMPVAGVDDGTLRGRFTQGTSRGSVIGKTGTLPRTDGGASALVGQMNTSGRGTLFFVIFNIRGGIRGFRRGQDDLVSSFQLQQGGAVPFNYQPRALTMRLANTETDAQQLNENEIPASAGKRP